MQSRSLVTCVECVWHEECLTQSHDEAVMLAVLAAVQVAGPIRSFSDGP
jgi:hypothetical protein